jgi:hypothetical protein
MKNFMVIFRLKDETDEMDDFVSVELEAASIEIAIVGSRRPSAGN